MTRGEELVLHLILCDRDLIRAFDELADDDPDSSANYEVAARNQIRSSVAVVDAIDGVA